MPPSGHQFQWQSVTVSAAARVRHTMKHWHIDEVAWDRFDPAKVEPQIVALVKAARMVERDGADYAVCLNIHFAEDPGFSQAADYWSTEEVQHGDALGRWAMLADPAETTRRP